MIEELELAPVDWEQLRLLAKLTPGERMMAMAQTSAFQPRAAARGVSTALPGSSHRGSQYEDVLLS